MIYIKLQVSGNIYYTNVLKEPILNGVVSYDAIDNELEFNKLVFKETELQAFAVLN